MKTCTQCVEQRVRDLSCPYFGIPACIAGTLSVREAFPLTVTMLSGPDPKTIDYSVLKYLPKRRKVFAGAFLWETGRLLKEYSDVGLVISVDVSISPQKTPDTSKSVPLPSDTPERSTCSMGTQPLVDLPCLLTGLLTGLGVASSLLRSTTPKSKMKEGSGENKLKRPSDRWGQ